MRAPRAVPPIESVVFADRAGEVESAAEASSIVPRADDAKRSASSISALLANRVRFEAGIAVG